MKEGQGPLQSRTKFMTSYLLISKNKKTRDVYLDEFANERNIDQLDRTIVEKDELSNTKSLGIGDIKNLQKKLFLKPFKSKSKLMVLYDAELLTTEAQNALLKILEEPPANTFIILVSSSKELMLPTILSRCTLITLDEELGKPTENEQYEMKKLLANLPHNTIGNALKLAELHSRNKDEALAWIEKLILTTRADLITKTIEKKEILLELKFLKSLQETYKVLKTTNVNVRLTIEHLFLNQL